MENIATSPKYQVTKKTISVIKNLGLEGVKTLKAEKITASFEVKHELHPKTKQPYKLVTRKKLDEVVEPMSFDLVEVTPEEVAIYRKTGISSFLLKVNGKLYHTSIPNNISFVAYSSTILGAHRCAVVGQECKRLSAASDEQGGCEKVRDRSHQIEKYPWITIGYETFNTKQDSFVVVNCLHYEKCPPRKKLPADKFHGVKLGLAQFLWDDVTSREDVQKHLEANHQKNDTPY